MSNDTTTEIHTKIPQDLSIPLYVSEIVETDFKEFSTSGQTLYKVKDRIYPIHNSCKDYYEVIFYKDRIGSQYGSHISGEYTCLNCVSRKCVHVRVCEMTDYNIRNKKEFTDRAREQFPPVPYKQLQIHHAGNEKLHVEDPFFSSDFGYFRIYKNVWYAPTCLGSSMRMETNFCIDCESTRCPHVHFLNVPEKNRIEHYNAKIKKIIKKDQKKRKKMLTP